MLYFVTITKNVRVYTGILRTMVYAEKFLLCQVITLITNQKLNEMKHSTCIII